MNLSASTKIKNTFLFDLWSSSNFSWSLRNWSFRQLPRILYFCLWLTSPFFAHSHTFAPPLLFSHPNPKCKAIQFSFSQSHRSPPSLANGMPINAMKPSSCLKKNPHLKSFRLQKNFFSQKILQNLVQMKLITFFQRKFFKYIRLHSRGNKIRGMIVNSKWKYHILLASQ